MTVTAWGVTLPLWMYLVFLAGTWQCGRWSSWLVECVLRACCRGKS